MTSVFVGCCKNLFGNRSSYLATYIATYLKSQELEIVEQHNYLGMCLHHRMSWQPHINLSATYRVVAHALTFDTVLHIGMCLQTIDFINIDYCSIWDLHQHKLVHKRNGTTPSYSYLNVYSILITS